MQFSKTYLFVTCLLVLSSSCFGDQGSPNKQSTKFAEQHQLLKHWIKRLVLSGPDADPAIYESKRQQVPYTGPNPLEPPVEVLDDPAKNESKRQVPTSPNPLHKFAQPRVEVLDDLPNYDLMRLVPSGTNHEESPDESPSKVYTPPPPSSRANYDHMRLVPSGPNHAVSPEELPSVSSAGKPMFIGNLTQDAYWIIKPWMLAIAPLVLALSLFCYQ